MNAITKMLRNGNFLRGVSIGAAAGLLVGSFVAFQVGANKTDIQTSVVKMTRRKKSPIDYTKLFV